MNPILLVLLALLSLAALPFFPYSRRWGWLPSSLLGSLLVVLLAAELVLRV